MANVNHLALKLFPMEGLFHSDPTDHGGPSNRGITLSTWRRVGWDKDGDADVDIDDIRLLTADDALHVLKNHYWDRWRADEIRNQKIADILVDWLWCSGRWGIIIPQRILRVKPDCLVGPVTLHALNNENPFRLLIKLYNSRVAFIHDIIKRDSTQSRFERRWYNRLNAYLY